MNFRNVPKNHSQPCHSPSARTSLQFLHNVSINLRPGGYFIGTVPDGKRINECIRSRRVFESPMLRIEAKWQGMPAVFGSPYICAIGDTVTGGEQGTAGSLEYLVYENVLAGVAAQYGLKPVLDYQAPNLESCLDPADGGKLLKHFLPVFPQSDPSLERASALFTTFVFQKTDAPEGRAPPLPGLVDATKARVPVLKRAREEQEAGPRGGAGEEPEAQKVKSGSGVEAAEEAAETAAPASGEKQAVKASSYKRPPPRKKPGAAGAEARDAPAAPPEGTA